MISMENENIKDIYNKITPFIESLDDVVNGIVSIDGIYAKQASDFLQKGLELFPMIIRSYSNDYLLS